MFEMVRLENIYLYKILLSPWYYFLFILNKYLFEQINICIIIKTTLCLIISPLPFACHPSPITILDFLLLTLLYK